MEEKVSIKIPKETVAELPKGQLGDVGEKIKRIDQLMWAILLVLVFSVVAILISVLGIFIDQIRYNNAAYREYSEKIETITNLRDQNVKLNEENKKNQDFIIQQQEQIINLLSK